MLNENLGFSESLPDKIRQAVFHKMKPYKLKYSQDYEDPDKQSILVLTFRFNNYPAFPADQHQLIVKFLGHKDPLFMASGRFERCLKDLEHLTNKWKKTGRT